MLHTAWKGTLSFGSIDIPIRLHTATEDQEIKLRSLHKECLTPIKYEKRCPSCEKDVDAGDIVKGYELEDGRFVVISTEELQEVRRPFENKDISMDHFIELNEVDPLYFGKSYYISPQETGERPYAILQQALLDTNKVGIAVVFLHSRQQVVLVRALEDVLIMHTLYFPEEIRDVENVPNLGDQLVDSQHKELAGKIINEMTQPFTPNHFHNQYRDSLKDLVEDKLAEGQVVSPKEPTKQSNVKNLMTALKMSIDSPPTAKPKRKTSPKKVSRPSS
ncbi:Ku protein [Priestia koreensis]|uniref:non-homologous end joining protein Ku n=1 Tax=Priestia koreensis TaxID=284581 RepID=UPI003D014D3C